MKQALFPLIALTLLFNRNNAQEFPSIWVPNFANDTSLVVRQNVCDRFKAYDRGEVELRRALEGLTLNTLLVYEEFVNLDEKDQLDGTYPGMIPLVMDELAIRAGFTWRNSFGMIPPPGEGKDWTEQIQWATEYFDVFAYWGDRTIERLKRGVTFPHGFYDASYILVGVEGGANDSKIDLWQWLEPFEAEVWYMIAITIVLSGVLFQLLDYVPENRKKKGTDEAVSDNVSEGVQSMGDGVYLSSMLFAQHFEFEPRTPASRLFSASLGLWALLISSNYTANLASFFVVESAPSIAVQSIEDATQLGQSICVGRGFSSHDFLLKEYPNARTMALETEADVLDAIRAGDCALGVLNLYSFQRLQSLQERNPDCNLHWVGRALRYVPSGLTVKADVGVGGRCSSLIHDVLNMHLMEMDSEGFLDQVWKDELTGSQDQDCAKKAQASGGSTNRRTLNEMAGTFVLHYVFGVVAIVFFIALRLNRKYKQMSDESRKELFESVRSSIRSDFLSLRQDAIEARPFTERTPSNDDIDDRSPVEGHAFDPPEASEGQAALDEQLERMKQKFSRRQDELELLVKEQMKTITALLRESEPQNAVVANRIIEDDFDDESWRSHMS